MNLEICDINIDLSDTKNGMIYIYLDSKGINKLKYSDDDSQFTVLTEWDNIKDIFCKPYSNLFKTFSEHLKSLSDYNYEVLSSNSSVVSSVSNGSDSNGSNCRDNDDYLKRIFIRGFASVIVLLKLIRTGRFFNHNIFDKEIEGPITANNMKLLRMLIYFHIVYTNDKSLLLQYSLDFINRWSTMLEYGDKVDKYNFMSILITTYIKGNNANNTDSDSQDRSISQRLERIEKILGIN